MENKSFFYLNEIGILLVKVRSTFFLFFSGPSSEETEKMRQRMMDCIEYGPNASWIPFPKSKQLYLAAKNNNLDLAKEAGRDGNINAYGTCNHWTPLHVACYHGSLGQFNLFYQVL